MNKKKCECQKKKKKKKKNNESDTTNQGQNKPKPKNEKKQAVKQTNKQKKENKVLFSYVDFFVVQFDIFQNLLKQSIMTHRIFEEDFDFSK